MSTVFLKVGSANGAFKKSSYKDYVLGVRDTLRDKLSGDDFIISDISSWYSEDDEQQSMHHCFILKKDEHEWLFFFGGRDEGSSSRDDVFSTSGYSNREIGIYDVTFSPGGWSCNLGYNYGEGSWGLQYDSPDLLTHSEGDFKILDPSPYVDSEAFFPDQNYKIMTELYPRVASDTPNTIRDTVFSLVINTDNPSIVSYGYDYYHKLNYEPLTISGKCLNVSNSDFTEIVFGSFTGGSFTRWDQFNDSTTSDRHGIFVKEKNNSITRCNPPKSNDTFIRQNHIGKENKFRALRVPCIANEVDIIGNYKLNIMCYAGAYRQPIDYKRVFKLNEGSVEGLIKINRSIATAWHAEKLPFPYNECDIIGPRDSLREPEE